MTSGFESNFYKIARLDQLAVGEIRTFHAAGATIFVRRSAEGVTAIDGSNRKSTLPPTSAEWRELESQAALPTKVDDGDLWVCIEDCNE